MRFYDFECVCVDFFYQKNWTFLIIFFFEKILVYISEKIFWLYKIIQQYQPCPPEVGCWVTVLVLVWVPPPHVALQAPN